MALLFCQAGTFALNGTMVSCSAGSYRPAISLTDLTQSLSNSSFPSFINASLPFNDTSSAIAASPLLQSVLTCSACPYGTYRVSTAGLDVSSCTKCPVGTYANQTGRLTILFPSRAILLLHLLFSSYFFVFLLILIINMMTGSTAESDCLRCPAGTTTAEEGSRVCICITPNSCDLPLPIEQGEAVEDYFLDGVDYFRETVPFVGRW